MRVLFISHQANRSGAPFALLQEVGYICSFNKHIIPFVLFLERGELEQEFRELCPTLYWNSLSLKIIRKSRTMWLLKRLFHFDCIYANSIISLDVALYVKQRLKIPLILHTHESESYLRSYINSVEKLKKVDAFLTVSELSKGCLVNGYGVDNSKIQIQRPFSPWVINVLKNKIPLSLPQKQDKRFVIGSICNGTWQKAPEIISLVANIFFKKYPQAGCKFMVAGIGEDNAAYYHLNYDLERMHIQDKVELVGRVNNPLDYYPQFDVFLLHSREESFSLVAEEAAICGLPIVGFKGATGATEWIKDGSGILVPYMDLDEMADALYILYSNKKFRVELGQKAKSVVESMYAKESQMKHVISVLKSVC